MTELAAEKTSLLTKRTNIFSNIEEYKETIADTQRSLDFHNMELTKNTEGNERKKEYCRVKNDEYEKTTTYRLILLLSILLFLIEHLTERPLICYQQKLRKRPMLLKNT